MYGVWSFGIILKPNLIQSRRSKERKVVTAKQITWKGQEEQQPGPKKEPDKVTGHVEGKELKKTTSARVEE